MTTTTNGQRRQTLASQIDRLDSILDGLSENLNGAVADAVKEAVAAAVQQAVVEVLTNPDLQQIMRPPASPTPSAASASPAPPTETGSTRNWLADIARKVRDWAAGCWSTLRSGARTLGAFVLTSGAAQVLGAGVLAAAAWWLCSPAVAGAFGTAVRAVGAFAMQLPARALSLLARTGLIG